MAAVDAALNAALKMAKTKSMYFAFLGKGTEGKLLVSKSKIPAKEIAEAKKELGGGAIVKGTCEGGEGKSMVFNVAKEPAGPILSALKRTLKETGLGLIPEFKVDAGAEDEGDESEGAESTDAASTDKAPPTAPPPAGLAGIQTLLKKLGFDPGKIDGVMGKHTQDAIKAFQKAHNLKVDGVAGPETQKALAAAIKGGGAPTTPPGDGKHDLTAWKSARSTAINELKALAKKVAGTRHGDAAAVLKEINAVISKLPDSPGPDDIDKLADFITKDDAITAAEESPKHFHDLVIRKPLLEALAGLRK
jgi:hypothetical protein